MYFVLVAILIIPRLMTMQALRYADNIQLPTFHNLVHLTLGVTFRKNKPGDDEFGGWRLLPSVLNSVPNLEVLVFEDVN